MPAVLRPEHMELVGKGQVNVKKTGRLALARRYDAEPRPHPPWLRRIELAILWVRPNVQV